eukprot:TRINITY_DN63355_c0_g2_i1.p1 TRINITY_DN63355_c0_g2~~TRINITY_DN63355_c0_g2_i1.p1  ORF type:complete len:246 (+),score=6.54 TRINITY_DN63355_c0_g2_i1:725-1462(+)
MLQKSATHGKDLEMVQDLIAHIQLHESQLSRPFCMVLDRYRFTPKNKFQGPTDWSPFRHALCQLVDPTQLVSFFAKNGRVLDEPEKCEIEQVLQPWRGGCCVQTVPQDGNAIGNRDPVEAPAKPLLRLTLEARNKLQEQWWTTTDVALIEQVAVGRYRIMYNGHNLHSFPIAWQCVFYYVKSFFLRRTCRDVFEMVATYWEWAAFNPPPAQLLQDYGIVYQESSSEECSTDDDYDDEYDDDYGAS